MSVTAETSQEEMVWLNEEALWNMRFMLVTAETFHEERSPSKAVALSNMLDMSVTAETSPVVEGLVEGEGAMEHRLHVSHLRDVP